MGDLVGYLLVGDFGVLGFGLWFGWVLVNLAFGLLDWQCGVWVYGWFGLMWVCFVRVILFVTLFGLLADCGLLVLGVGLVVVFGFARYLLDYLGGCV